jgi:hypothetical protein
MDLPCGCWVPGEADSGLEIGRGFTGIIFFSSASDVWGREEKGAGWAAPGGWDMCVGTAM